MIVKGLVSLIGAIAVQTLAMPALADIYPSKPVRVVVPFAAGATDALARTIAEKLQERTGQPFIVDNKPGASTMIGTDAVAKAPADGYTLLVTVDVSMTQLPDAMQKLPYVPERDFAPVSMLATNPAVLIGSPKSPSKTFKDLLNFSRTNPGKVNYGTAMLYGQIVGEQLKGSGLTYAHVPYRGGAPLVQAVMAGEVDLGIIDLGSAVAAGDRLQPLLITSASRHPKLPNVPTARELGAPQLEGEVWFAMFAPAGTPKPIVEQLNNELRAILGAKEVRERLANMALEARPSTPDQLAEIVKTDGARWGKVIREAGIRLD